MDNVPKAQREMYTVLPEMTLRPADAYDRLVRGAVESVGIDALMGRTLAVMVVPYPPGIPLIMPGERITEATKSIQDYLVYARAFDRKFPGFETDIHGLRFQHDGGERKYLVDCIKEEAVR
jgi:arginine decarboxylase